jgi:membrane protein insertase Oxa1/YidC/SpoIIIJ
MSGWISYTVPQGLGLYWFINSVLQIIIQLVSDKILDKDNGNTTNSNGEVVLKPIEAIKEEKNEDNKENVEKKEQEKKGPNPNSSKKKKKKK